MKDFNTYSLFVLLMIVLGQTEAKSQTIDTLKIETTLSKIVEAFSEKSFEKFEQLLLRKKDYLARAVLLSGNPNLENELPEIELQKLFSNISQKDESTFNQIVEKGNKKKIEWNKVLFDGFVFSSDKIMIGNQIKPEGFIVDAHIRIKSGKKFLTIIGIELWLFDNDYRLDSDNIRGLFEIYLDSYISSDDFYIDEMEDYGY